MFLSFKHEGYLNIAAAWMHCVPNCSGSRAEN